MPYLKVGSNNKILDIESDDAPGLVFVEDISQIVEHKYGHVCFDYIGGVVVLNQTRVDAIEVDHQKGAERRALIEQEMKHQAELTISADLAAIDATKTMAELKTWRESKRAAAATKGKV